MTNLVRAIVCSIILTTVFAASARAGKLVIIASDVPGLAAGDIIGTGDALEIPKGASITLVAENGEPINLVGPFSGSPGQAAAGGGTSGLIDALALLMTSPDNYYEPGASRAIGGGASQELEVAGFDDVWMVNVTRRGPRCLPAGVPVLLWRPEPRPEVKLSVGRTTANTVVKLTWPRDAATIGWPAEVTIVDGAAYSIRQDISKSADRVTLRLIPIGFANSAHLALWLEDVSCTQQARAVLGNLGSTGGATDVEISTDKGKAPVYGIGENVEFRVRANRDAYLYCFYNQVDGKVIRILPNRFAPSVRVLANFPHHFPDERMHFDLTLSSPLGKEAIACFATDRDVMNDLPTDVQSIDLVPLAGYSLADLNKIFEKISNARIAVSNLNFTVTD